MGTWPDFARSERLSINGAVSTEPLSVGRELLIPASHQEAKYG